MFGLCMGFNLNLLIKKTIWIKYLNFLDLLLKFYAGNHIIIDAIREEKQISRIQEIIFLFFPSKKKKRDW
ncbi:unnamed protein product [Brassica oleracea var. botrytis]